MKKVIVSIVAILIIWIIIIFSAYAYNKYFNVTPIGLLPSASKAQVSGNVSDLINISIIPGQEINHQVAITGQVKGGYFFEGQTHGMILDSNKNILGRFLIMAQSDWMNSDAVSFYATVGISPTVFGPSYIRIANDNPSGDVSKDKYIDIPVFIKKEQSSTNTYLNSLYKFSVDYPLGWSYRETPDLSNGAGFSPNTQASSPDSEVVQVFERGRGLNDCGIPFDEYVKKVAANNIQNFEKLNSLENIVTQNGTKGYKTTWLVRDMYGKSETISLPMTYFEDKSQSCSNGTGYVELDLSNKDYLKDYSNMLDTFKFIK